MIERTAQVDQLAFAVVGRSHSRNKGSIGEPRRYAPGDIGRRGALGDVLDAAIRQCDVNLFHVRPHLEEETSSLSAALGRVKAESIVERRRALGFEGPAAAGHGALDGDGDEGRGVFLERIAGEAYEVVELAGFEGTLHIFFV